MKKILVINGSPKKEQSTTMAVTNAFVKGLLSSGKYESETEGDSIRIRFKNAGALKTLDGSGTVKGFAIAGSDRKFHFAQARIEGTSVVVSCPEVKFPLAVRYAWGANPDCNLCGETLLPVGSFRTDHWGR